MAMGLLLHDLPARTLADRRVVMCLLVDRAMVRVPFGSLKSAGSAAAPKAGSNLEMASERAKARFECMEGTPDIRGPVC
ncbi:uncharacterized protein ColSpa_08080 [Colletotrichum spaethianum]|uniref:Uncharacterized protein n=1 Tax=Colletotrichum spaethianum TaxID=700344 RepID=A0AA37P934_9PEZI|nr:uncharacterized protein ColSpa_08080 [Colletotrichum spaethianum]GKT47899.1 hypothetical protein ColSpa_08080 [Colletotrichum spaethianum]